MSILDRIIIVAAGLGFLALLAGIILLGFLAGGILLAAGG